LPGAEGQEQLTGLTLQLAGEAPSKGMTHQVMGRCRYIFVRIFNGDDAPLKFMGMKVRRLQEYVAFRAEPAGSYELFFGNTNTWRVQYDLANYADRLRSEGVAVATLGAVAPNPLYAAKTKVVPWSERHVVILWTGLAVVLGVLTALVLRQARQAKTLGGNERKAS